MRFHLLVPGGADARASARVIDTSESGCLIEIRRRLDVGTVGTRQLQLGAAEFRVHFEVVRCQAVERAGSLYHMGVRFLWTTPRHVGSISQRPESIAADPQITRGRLLRLLLERVEDIDRLRLRGYVEHPMCAFDMD